MRIVALALAATTVAGSLTALVPPLTASAHCSDMGYTYYTFKNIKKSRLATNLKSDYLHGPGTIHYTKTKTASVSVTGTVTVGAEAGVIFAKASASASVAVGGTWTHGGSWSYDKPVPKGRTARLVMFHESRSFDVTKHRLDYLCRAQTVWTHHMNAPRTANINVWDLQYA